MEGEDRMGGREQAVDRVPEFVGQRGHVTGLALEVEEHVGGHTGHGAVGKGARAFPVAGEDIDVPGLDDLAHQRFELGVELPESLADQRHRFVEGVLALVFPDRGVEVVAGKPLHAERPGLEAEIGLEGLAPLFRGFQQSLDHGIGKIVHLVPGRDRGWEAPEFDVFVLPVLGHQPVELPKDHRLFAVALEHGVVGGLADGGVLMAGVA